jgi:hypothetical protein
MNHGTQWYRLKKKKTEGQKSRENVPLNMGLIQLRIWTQVARYLFALRCSIFAISP